DRRNPRMATSVSACRALAKLVQAAPSQGTNGFQLADKRDAGRQPRDVLGLRPSRVGSGITCRLPKLRIPRLGFGIWALGFGIFYWPPTPCVCGGTGYCRIPWNSLLYIVV